jgi:hypothetical protein
MHKGVERLVTPHGILFAVDLPFAKRVCKVFSQEELYERVGRRFNEMQPDLNMAMMLTGLSGNTKYIREAVGHDNELPILDEAECEFAYTEIMKDIERGRVYDRGDTRGSKGSEENKV